MDKETIEGLNWFLNFAYTDTDQLSIGELNKLTTEISQIHLKGILSKGFISGYTGHKIFESVSNLIKGYEGFARIKELQVWFKKEFEAIMKKIHEFEPRFGPLERKGAPERQLQSFSLLDNKPTVNLTVNAEIVVFGERPGGGGLRTAASDWRENAKIIISTEVPKEKDSLILEFLKAIDGVQLNALRKCCECGRWFLRTGRRKKIYCSNLCAARKSNRERRKKIKKENPEAYEKELENNRLRARKSYEEKIRKKTPGAVIGRRKRK